MTAFHLISAAKLSEQLGPPLSSSLLGSHLNQGFTALSCESLFSFIDWVAESCTRALILGYDGIMSWINRILEEIVREVAHLMFEENGKEYRDVKRKAVLNESIFGQVLVKIHSAFGIVVVPVLRDRHLFV